MPKYNHAYTIAFEIVSDHPHGDDLTAEQVRNAILARVERCYHNGELLAAVDCPYDTFEEE